MSKILKSKVTNPLEFTNFVTAFVNEREEVHAINADSSKAFDSFDRTLILKKWGSYNFPPFVEVLLKW